MKRVGEAEASSAMFDSESWLRVIIGGIMSAPSVGYKKVGQSESETTLFDYSSAFSYADPNKFKSAFNYGMPVPLAYHEYDIQRNRGLQHKPLAVKLLHWGAVAIFILLIVLTFPISIWFVIKKIRNDEQMVLSRLGIIKCLKGPTITMVIPCVDKVKRYSTSLRSFNIPPQKVMTSDGLVVELGGVLRYHVVDAEKMCFAAQSIDHTMRVTAQTVSSNYIHRSKEKELTDTAGINAINNALRVELQKTFLPWGIAINSYEMCGLKAVLRVEQQDALSDIVEPLKQWFFGGHDAGGPSAAVAGSSMMQQMASMFTTTAPASTTLKPSDLLEAAAQPSSSPSAGHTPDLSSLTHSLTPNDLLAVVKTISNRQLVEQVGTIYTFNVPDATPTVYYMDLKHGEGDCGVGEPPLGKADTTITITLTNMQQMFAGALQPFDAYMSGALQISGDVSGAMKLDELVKTIASVSAKTDVKR